MESAANGDGEGGAGDSSTHEMFMLWDNTALT